MAGSHAEQQPPGAQPSTAAPPRRAQLQREPMEAHLQANPQTLLCPTHSCAASETPGRQPGVAMETGSWLLGDAEQACTRDGGTACRRRASGGGQQQGALATSSRFECRHDQPGVRQRAAWLSKPALRGPDVPLAGQQLPAPHHPAAAHVPGAWFSWAQRPEPLPARAPRSARPLQECAGVVRSNESHKLVGTGARQGEGKKVCHNTTPEPHACATLPVPRPHSSGIGLVGVTILRCRQPSLKLASAVKRIRKTGRRKGQRGVGVVRVGRVGAPSRFSQGKSGEEQSGTEARDQVASGVDDSKGTGHGEWKEDSGEAALRTSALAGALVACRSAKQLIERACRHLSSGARWRSGG